MEAARKNDSEGIDNAVFMTKDSAFYAYLLKELEKYKEYPDDAEGVRRILDAELGERTLTEELYKMRGE